MITHKRLDVAAIFAILACTSAPGYAMMGCGYSYNGGNGVVLGDATEAEERAYGIKHCSIDLKNVGCQIISCKANLDTVEQARQIWPPPPGNGRQRNSKCGSQYGTKC